MKLFRVKKFLRKNSQRQNVRATKKIVRQKVQRQKLFTAKRPYDEVSLQQSVPTTECPAAKCPTTKNPTGKNLVSFFYIKVTGWKYKISKIWDTKPLDLRFSLSWRREGQLCPSWYQLGYIFHIITLKNQGVKAHSRLPLP